MKEKTKRLKYERPFARDLSVFSAKGDGNPTGACWSGTTPYSNCTDGQVFTTQNCSEGTYPTWGDACSPGGTPAGSCFPGTFPGGARCEIGSKASMSCYAGTGA